jgi:IS5 family transposase
MALSSDGGKQSHDLEAEKEAGGVSMTSKHWSCVTVIVRHLDRVANIGVSLILRAEDRVYTD